MDKVPRIINPDKGFMVTANNRVTSPNVQYDIGTHMASPYRSERITQMIEKQIKSGVKFSVDDLIKMQRDTFDLQAEHISNFLLMIVRKYKDEVISNLPRKMQERARDYLDSMVKQMQYWNFKMDINQIEPTIYTTWEHQFFFHRLLRDIISDNTLRETLLNNWDAEPFIYKLVKEVSKDP